MPKPSRGVLKSADSTASSCFQSTSSSVVHPSTSETSHSAFEDKPVKSSVKNIISSGENGSSEIFSLSDQQLSEKMKFIQEIGFGNWGSVWLCEPRLAEDRAVFGERVAVKLVHRSKTPTTAARVRSLWNEMKIVRALRREATEDTVGVGHPSVVQFYSFVITPSYALITMQYLPTPVPVEVPEFRAKPWFAALTEAVAFLHQRGVVHNDIKPANILLTGASPPTPVLVDFGFAEHYSLTSRHAFQSNLAYGTPEYLAPERARGQPHDTRKADVYALGVTFFEILVGRTPFEEVEGESFVSKEDLERYWTRTVKGKWIGKWEGIMSKQCEKALKRMTVPNADLRVMAADVLNDPYFTGEDETNYSLSVDLSALTEMIPPWSRPVLAASKQRANSGTKDAKPNVTKAPRSIRAAASATKDKENTPPARSDTVKSRTSTLHRTSKSITEAFRKSVGASRRAPKPTVADVFNEEAPKKTEPAIAPKVKSSNTVLRVKNSAVVSKDKSADKHATSASREKKIVVPALKERNAGSAVSVPKKELAKEKENVKPKSQGRTLSMGLSFTRSFGRKKANEKTQEENLEVRVDRRESMYFARTPNAAGALTSRSAISPTPPPKDQAKVQPATSRTASPTTAPAPAKSHARSTSNPRDVRVIFSIDDTPTSTGASNVSETVSSRTADTPVTPQSATYPASSKLLDKEFNSQNTSSVRNRKSLFIQTHDIAQPERIHPSENEEAAMTKKPSTLREAGTPKLSTIAQSAVTASPSHYANSTINSIVSLPATPNKTRASKIAAKENRRSTVVAKPTRGTPVKTRSSPSRVRASPAKARGANVPVFTIPKAGGGATPKSATKGRAAKVLGDATNTTTPTRAKKTSQISKAVKQNKVKTDEGHDEGDDTITLPIDVFQNVTSPRAPKGSTKSIIKHGLRQSIDKAIRFGRTSISATESTHYPASESTQHRRSLSVGEAWNDDAVNRIISSSMPAVRHALQNEQMGPDGQVDRMAIWIRNVEKVVEEARQSFQVESTSPLPLPPPPPRLNHSQSAGLTRISTSAKDPTIRTLTSHANPSVTTFACAPQAPNRARRATVGPASSPGINASFTIIEPTSPTPPRLSEVFDSDSRKLILAPVGISETPVYSIDFERSSSVTATRPKSQQSTYLFRTPSPTINEPTSPTTASRPATSMSMRAKNISQAENDYDRYLMTQTTVLRKGKGYQSDFTLRGKGIEHIPAKHDAPPEPTRKRSSVFNRFISPNNTVSDRTGPASRVASAFRTIVARGPKKREAVDASIIVGGGFGQRINHSQKAQTWSRAQAV
ncbi:CAMK/CAMK1 protein kinase [Ceratobasidium sp. AG-Ba]|nr:CAMK/CAMK1 protein kinase [Ceratobasidium sp. AG-Ba]QRW15121.1 CAMK/CAMK1 protein kinase [Ceratobasidium sp. AG-Ba]